MAAKGNLMSDQQRFRSAIAVAILTVWTKPIIGQQDTRPVVEVRVLNQAEMAADVLSRAKEGVVRLFRETGIDVIWIDTAPETTTNRFSVQVILRHKGPTPVLGTTFSGTHDRCGTVFVYQDHVLQVALQREQDVAGILAYTIGHEMGHLLLAHPAHSAAGVMRASWDANDLWHIASGSLHFTAEQATAIHARLSSCC